MEVEGEGDVEDDVASIGACTGAEAPGGMKVEIEVEIEVEIDVDDVDDDDDDDAVDGYGDEVKILIGFESC